MINIHEAIRATHEGVIAIIGGSQNDIVAKDKDQNFIVIDWDAVAAWVDPNAYKQQRAKAYPSMADQLDTIYHEGIDAWRATIAAVKQEYPKP